MRAYLYVILLLAAIFGSIGAYLANRFAALANADFQPPPVVIAASYSRSEQWEDYLDAVGTIRAERGVELTSEESGEVTRINFESGDKVAAGQLMVVLNDKVEEASRRSQIATLELARLLFERDQKLLTQKSIPETQYDRSKADLERASAQLAETEARLKNKRIHAPFSGTAGLRQIDRGDYVSPGTVIATLQDLDELEIDFTIPATVAPLLQPGQAITLQVDAFPEREIRASLFALDARVDPGTRNIQVRARIVDGDGLIPGMFAQLRINLGRPRQVVTVPETAISYALHGSTVFLVTPQDDELTVESVIVTTGEVRDGRVAIVDGLAPDTRVVTAGQNKLFRGARIVVDEKVVL